MKRVSNKKALMIRKAKKGRDAFAFKYARCMACGSTWSLETHEIARGVYRNKAYMDRCCWLRLCPVCHDQCDDYSIWPLKRQLALKQVCDPGHYDLDRFNAIRARAHGAITQEEVDAYLFSLATQSRKALT